MQIPTMKCNKKKIIILFSTIAIIVLLAVVASILLIPSAKEIATKSFPWTKRCTSGDCNHHIERYAKPVREICTTKECLITKAVTKAGPNQRGLCTSDDCVVEAAKILKLMDQTVDPCEDFYNFSCGNFFKTYSLPEGWFWYSVYHLAEQAVDLKVRNILETPVKVNESDALLKVKKLYRSCMNIAEVERHSLDDMKDLLTNKGIGEWPFLNEEWQDCRLDLEWRMGKLNALGIGPLFQIKIEFKGYSRKAYAYLIPASPLVSDICDEDYENATQALEKVTEQKEILTSVLTLMGVEITNVTEQDIDDLFLFDFAYCNITKEARQHYIPINEPTSDNHTLDHIIDIAPEINWIRWRNILFSELRLNFPHDKMNIYVHGLDDCIQQIIELLHSTSSKIVANYMTWKFVFHHLGFMGRQFQQIIENHPKLFRWNLLYFMKPDRGFPRWQQCVRYAEKLMPMSILPQYLPRLLTPDMQREMNYVVNSVKNEFKDIFRKNSALLRDEKVKSIHKIDQVDIKLFYPDRERKFYDKYYSDMGKLGDSFLKNSLKVKMSYCKRSLEGAFLAKSVFDLEYRSVYASLYDSNAVSLFHGNKIVIYLGEFELSKISSRLPRFLSMSTFGFLIGHELMHGFDVKSIVTSVKTQTNWTTWPDYVVNHITKKAQCFLDQYSLLRALNETNLVNESNYVNDDISDNQGIYLAYKAYMNYLMNYGEEKYLPGLSYSNEQLFFIRYAQSWCSITSPDFYKDSPYHSASPLRVNEVMKNFQPFAEHFRCSLGDTMHPPRKCQTVWD